ncbi:MAG: fibronectin type III domain-containing protein, partial [Trebonia sp.]
MPATSDPAPADWSRRQVLAASGTGLLAASAVGGTAGQAHASAGIPSASTSRTRSSGNGSGNGTPEQIHLTWGEDPATSVVISWASPGRSARPRVRIGQRVFHAE